MKDILERPAYSSPSDGSHDFYCRCLDAEEEIMTTEEIIALQAAKLDMATPFVICGVSDSQFSIARLYGGCKIQGQHYRYIPTTDELLRDDVAKWLEKHRAQRKAETATQGELVSLPIESTGTLNDLLCGRIEDEGR